jgi:4-hydroxy-tetrahydrodipicolinate synthase
VITALVTPFRSDDALDEDCLAELVQYQIAAGVDAILVIGGTGEYINLTMAERFRAIRCAVEAAEGRIPVIVGALSPGMRDDLEVGLRAAETGATALLLLPPYYVHTDLDGIVDHFGTVARETQLPIIVYNNRVGWNAGVDAMAMLADIPEIVGVKEMDRDLASVTAKISRLGSRLAFLDGTEDLALQMLLSGASGGMWAGSNFAPHLLTDLYTACRDGRLDEARRLAGRVSALFEAASTVNFPSGVKEGLALLGRPVGAVRRPLHQLSPVQRDHLVETFELNGLL